MPCRDYSDDGVPERMMADHRLELDRQKGDHQAKMDRMAQMLCAALTMIELEGLNTPEICVQWWKAHKKIDKERRQREAEAAALDKERNNALRKLNKRDREVLNLPRRLK